MRIHVLALILILLFCPAIAHANDVAAIKAAAGKNYNVSASTALGRQIVEWYALSQGDNVSFTKAYQFLRTHQDWPATGAIRANAEKSLSPSVPTATVLQYFNAFPPVTAVGMKQYLNALIAGGQTQKALSTLRNWWIDASLTPGEQKDFIKTYGQYLGTQDYERRLRTIIHDKFYTNARALAVKLGKGYPQLVEAKISLIKNNEALKLARLQWRRKNGEDAGAIELLRSAPAANQLSNPSDWWKERHIMVRRLMEEKKWGSAYALARDHRQKDGFPYAQAEFVAGWLALRKIGKPWEAFEHFERLFNAVESPISRSRGAYWAGLASDALKHPEIAVQWYQVAAKYQTTYYGQMAAGRINLPLGLVNPTPIQVTSAARAQFKSSPLIAAALLLKQAGQRGHTKQFIYAYADNQPDGLKYTLTAELAKSFNMNDGALRIAKRPNVMDILCRNICSLY
jgi:soluble lytic murein transglycosylase